jgi:serralysin
MKNKYLESIFLDRRTSWEESTHGAQLSIGDWLGRNLLDPFPAKFQPIFGEISFNKAVGAPPKSTSSGSTTLISIGPNVIEALDAAASTSTQYSLSIGQTARGVISSTGDHDFYKVTLVAGQYYTFAQIGTGINSLQDTYLSIRNSTNKIVASNDDGGSGTSSLLTYKPTTSGTYYIDAGAYNNLSTGQYGISVTAGTKASFNIEMGGGAIDSFRSWAPIGTDSSVTVTYGFRSSAPTSYTPPANFSPLSADQIAAVKAILALWSDVARVNFTQVIDTTLSGINQYSNNATIEIANYSANDGSGAFAYYPGSTDSSSAAGDLWLNLAGGVTTSGVNAGTFGYFAIMHELGHAIGLSHPGDYNAGSGGTITYSSSAQFIQDSQQYSVMSYFGGSNTGETAGGFATAYTPMILDIYELQQLYGANMTTRTGDTTYGFNTTEGDTYGFSGITNPQFCIWDAGGIDTLDGSQYSSSQSISLVAGTYSSVGGLNNNISIALGCTIENAIGGYGSDTITGNQSVNVLTGGGGADIFRFDAALASTNWDTLRDFTVIDDTIQLENSIFIKLTATGVLAADNFKSSTNGAAVEADDYILYNSNTGVLYYDADGSGAAAATQFATLTGLPTLTSADFVVT